MSENKPDPILVLLTQEFPFGKGETFLENEWPYLLGGFSNVCVFAQNGKGESRVSLENVDIIAWQRDKWARVKAFFSSVLWIEMRQLLISHTWHIAKFRTAWYTLTKAFEVRKAIEAFVSNKEGASIIIYSYWLDEKALGISLMKTRHNIKILSRMHNWDIYEERQPYQYLPFRKYLLSRLDKLVSISKDGADYLSRRYPGHNYKTKVSRLGTLLLQGIPQNKNMKAFHLLSVSSLTPVKQVDKIIDILAEIRGMEVHWTHIGSGPLMDDIKSYAGERLDKIPQITYSFLGQLRNIEVRTFLENNYVDLFINTSSYEGIPVSIMEVQSAGIPVMATAVGGVPEIVNEENGFLLDKEFDVKHAAQVIIDYMQGVVEQTKRDAAYLNWKKNYSASHNYPDFINQLRNLSLE